jgi:transposase-like protein
MASEPKTLQQAINYFADPNNCIDYLANRRWGKDGVTCPTCGSREVSFVPSRRVWQCKTRHAKCQFSIKVGTIFEDSPIGLDKWLTAMWMLANCKNGVSSWEIHRALGVTQKSAWFMLQRIRLALQGRHSGKLGGPGSEIEIDETFIGGKARNMHKERRSRLQHYGRAADKAIVMGILERRGQVHAKVVPEAKKHVLYPEIKGLVQTGSTVYTDQAPVYYDLGKEAEYDHQVINHLEKYVDGRVSTNGIENFWSLLKRGLNGTYVNVEPFHLFRYVDEQVFRYNNRKDINGEKLNDADRFNLAVSQIIGKRLTYAEVTGKVGETPF